MLTLKIVPYSDSLGFTVFDDNYIELQYVEVPLDDDSVMLARLANLIQDIAPDVRVVTGEEEDE